MMKRRRNGFCTALVGGALLFVSPLASAAERPPRGPAPAPAGAITPDATPTPRDGAGALALAQALSANPAEVTGAAFDAIPPGGQPAEPNGTSGPLGGFPTSGATHAILTSGDVRLADQPNTNDASGADLLGGNARGDTDLDVTILRVTFAVPAGRNCMGVDLKFLSEEYPEYVGTVFNDAFIAELDSSTWTTSGSTITAPNNFATDVDGNILSINEAGFTAANAAGTTYDGATSRLSALTQITPGSHVVFLSIFDQGDNFLDSAIFIDNLRFFTVANPATQCVAGIQPSCEGFAATIEGTLGDDNIVGSAGDDVIVAKDGNDTIDGGAGNDRICGGAGDDSVKGGAGNDIVNGDVGVDTIDFSGAAGPVSGSLAVGTATGEGSDTLRTLENIIGSPGNDGLGGNDLVNRIDGGGGNDTLSGRGDDDLLNGDGGNDTVRGGPGHDQIDGGVGDDLLYGENDDDLLNGGDGADYIEGGFGADTVDGQGGNDVLYESSVLSGPDGLTGGAGIDSVSYWGRTAGVTLTIDGAANDGGTGSGEGDNIALDVERLFGSTAPDVLTGSAGDNNLYGGNGNDQLNGLDGNDFFDGGNDNDVFDGGPGIDTASYSSRAVSVYVSLDGLPNDGRDVNLDRVAEEADNVLATIEVVVGSSAPDILVGGPAADTLSGFGGNDRLEGNGGNDRLAGGDGNDQLLGGAGADSHEGGAGIDTGSYEGRTATVTVDMDDLADDGEAGEADNVRSDVEFLIGGDGDDSLTGSAAVNRIFGRAGADTISGLGGDDHLLGEAGNDTLNGGDGNDTLDGGADTDTCVQGAGSGALISCEL